MRQTEKESGGMPERGKKAGLSNAVLKNIAYVTMLVDHFSLVLYWPWMQKQSQSGLDYEGLYVIYQSGRAIGRIAFVLFAYLLAEGLFYTANRKKYLLRVGLFALVSEIPFDLAFSGIWLDMENQNIYFTLLLGMAAVCLLERWRNSAAGKFLAVTACCVLAMLLRTDYMFMGVLLIVVFYLFHDSLLKQMFWGSVVLYAGIVAVYAVRYLGQGCSFGYLAKSGLREMYGAAAFALLALYNGKKGRQLPRAVCYGFYPVHLLLLYGIRMAAG